MPPGARTDPIIRPATTADLPRIGRLGAMLAEQHHRWDARRFIALGSGAPSRYAAFIGTQLGDPDRLVLVAEDHGDVVGYAFAGLEDYDYMSLRGPAGALYDIIVDPDFRGRGLGRRLLDAILEDLRSRGTPRVVLSTATENVPAQRLFERAGFRRTMIEMTRELEGEKP